MEAAKNNLNTFRVLYLVKGILTLCFSIVFIIYGCLGFLIGAMAENSDTNTELPFNFGWIFAIIGGIGLLFCITIGVLTLLASKYIKNLKNYNFIFVIAVVNCLTGILGIVLGIFTLIEMSKPEIKTLFNKA
ncbi:hypothetical protein AAFN75_02210 [Algibacter sp. AS12]|uniref:hypothetical protein n=1 Tax=Algibacter sp. AS12 TaxID=3135773 RepID=UPI00398AF1D8